MTSPTLLESYRCTVLPEWIDYNGHMNLAYYVLVFDYATDALLDAIGMTEAFRNVHAASTFSAEIHVNYLRELRDGDRVRVTTQVLDFDAKRIHYFHRMHDEMNGALVATNELLSLYMDMRTRRVGTMPAEIRERLRDLREAHAARPWPEQAGSVIRVRRREGRGAPSSGL